MEVLVALVHICYIQIKRCIRRWGGEAMGKPDTLIKAKQIPPELPSGSIAVAKNRM